MKSPIAASWENRKRVNTIVEPSASVPLKVSPELTVTVGSKNGIPLNLKSPPITSTSLPETAVKVEPVKIPPLIFTSLPERALKKRPNTPPLIFTSLPSLASKRSPTDPPLIFIWLPEFASKLSPTVPPLTFTSLPKLASKSSPSEPPKIFTSLPILASSLSAIKPPSKMFCWTKPLPKETKMPTNGGESKTRVNNSGSDGPDSKTWPVTGEENKVNPSRPSKHKRERVMSR